MRAYKRTGIVFVIAGMVLILSALSLFLFNCYEDMRAGRESASLLEGVQDIIEDREAAFARRLELPDDQEMDHLPEMPVVEIDGYGYVGYLIVPDLKMQLPIMSESDAVRLKIAPCRQVGSSRTDDLVIAAHHYDSHFRPLFDIKKGAGVVFTDMDGIKNYYRVVRVDTLRPTEVEAVLNSGHHLVLYTCTYSIRDRVVVFCDRTEEFPIWLHEDPAIIEMEKPR